MQGGELVRGAVVPDGDAGREERERGAGSEKTR